MVGLVFFTSVLLLYGILLSSTIWLPFVPNERMRRKIRKVIVSDRLRFPASWIAIFCGIWNLFAPDFGAMNSPTILGALIPSVLLIIDGIIICPESIQVIRIPKQVRSKWLKRILWLGNAVGPITILAAVLHAIFFRSLLF